jgi:hypothetical protein
MSSYAQVAGDLLDYLNSNLLTLSEHVYVETFTIVLEELWEAVKHLCIKCIFGVMCCGPHFH